MGSKNQPIKELQDRDWLYQKYVVDNMTSYEIGKLLNCGHAVVSKYLKKHNIKIRSVSSYTTAKAAISPNLDPLLLNKDWLFDKYITQKMSTRDVASLLSIGCKRSVKKALKFHSIPERDLKEARSNRSSKGSELRSRDDGMNSEELLKDLYLNQKKTIFDIVEETGLSYGAIKRRFELWGIETKSVSDLIEEGNFANTGIGRKIGAISYEGKWQIMRSSWEKKYFEYLKSKNIKFEYETKKFDLGNGIFYTPDFYLPETDEHIEIKGFLSEIAKEKYDKFKTLYPNIKWKLLFQKDLEELGIDIKKHMPTVYLVCGLSGSGKSWVCSKLQNCTYIQYDKTKKDDMAEILNIARQDKKVIIYDPTTLISTFIKTYSSEYDIKPVFIEESLDTVKERIEGRNGEFNRESMETRAKRLKSLSDKYGVFVGTSLEVIVYLQAKLK